MRAFTSASRDPSGMRPHVSPIDDLPVAERAHGGEHVLAALEREAAVGYFAREVERERVDVELHGHDRGERPQRVGRAECDGAADARLVRAVLPLAGPADAACLLVARP